MTNYLPGTQADQDKTKDIKQVAQQLGLAVEVRHFQAVVDGWPRQIKAGMARVVDPFANRKEDAAQGDELDGGIADALQGDGQRQSEQKGAEYEHGLVPIVNNELRKRVSGLHFGLLLGVCGPHYCGWRRGAGVSLVTGLLLLMVYGLVADNHTGSWSFISTTKQVDVKKNLPSAAVVGYVSRVTGIPVTGICSPESIGGQKTAISPYGLMVFLCPNLSFAPFGRGWVGSLRARRVPFDRSANPLNLSHFAFCSAMGGKVFSFSSKGVRS